MLKKIVAGILILLALSQVILIVLQIMQVLNLPIIWLFAPVLIGLFFGMIFIVGSVLWAEKQEKM